MANIKQKIELEAQKRSILGKKVKSLRDSGLIPGVLYGKDQEAIPLQVIGKDFYSALKEAGESSLVYLNIDSQSFPTIIHDLARDPLSDDVIHTDFYKVRLDQKIKADVVLEFEGESPAVKNLGGILVTNIHEIEVEALPQDLPQEIRVDISSLVNLNDHILVKDINVGENVKLLAEDDAILALIQEPKSQEDLDEELSGPTGDVSDVEIGKEKKEDEESDDATDEDTGDDKKEETKKEDNKKE
jgi:large subunit ribosomal protein L25